MQPECVCRRVLCKEISKLNIILQAKLGEGANLCFKRRKRRECPKQRCPWRVAPESPPPSRVLSLAEKRGGSAAAAHPPQRARGTGAPTAGEATVALGAAVTAPAWKLSSQGTEAAREPRWGRGGTARAGAHRSPLPTGSLRGFRPRTPKARWVRERAAAVRDRGLRGAGTQAPARVTHGARGASTPPARCVLQVSKVF